MKKTFLLSATLTLLFVACSKDDSPSGKFAPKDPEYHEVVNDPSTGEVAVIDVANVKSIYAENAADLPTQNDVKILNSDTTRLQISKSYLAKNEISIHNDMTLILNLDEYSLSNFILSNIQEEGSYYTMDVAPAPIDKVFSKLKMSFDAPLVDDAEPASASRVSQSSYDKVLSKVIVHNEDGTKEVLYDRQNASRAGASTEVKIKVNAPGDIKLGNTELCFYKDNPTTDRGTFELSAGASFYIDFDKLAINKIEATAKVKADVRFPLILKYNEPTEKSYTFLTLDLGKKRFDFIFLLGPLPVDFAVTPALNLSASASVKGKEDGIQLGYYAGYTSDASSKYENGSWSSSSTQDDALIGDSAYDFDYDVPYPSPNTSAKVNIGLYGKVSLGLYFIDAVSAKLGPAIEISSSADANRNITNKATLKMRANFWAGVKIFLIKLPGWERWWDLYSLDLPGYGIEVQSLNAPWLNESDSAQ